MKGGPRVVTTGKAKTGRLTLIVLQYPEMNRVTHP
jgi:hypothetical protein